MVEPENGWAHGNEPTLAAAIGIADRLDVLHHRLNALKAARGTLGAGDAAKAIVAAEDVIIREMTRLAMTLVPPLQ